MSDPAWYRRWFGEEYLDLYPHRDREEAEAAVSTLLKVLPLPSRSPVLDLACGPGRHLEALRRRGLEAVGLDLSFPLLRRARDLSPGSKLVRGDMRALPFQAGSFSVVTSFFTSFGYFETEAEDRRVLGQVRRVLRPEGHLFLDFLNAEEVRRTLVPRDERRVGKRRVIQERSLLEGGRFVEKRIRIQGEQGESAQTFRERVRLYSGDELEDLLGSQGLAVRERLGDYQGQPYSPEAPRLILLARAAGRPAKAP